MPFWVGVNNVARNIIAPIVGVGGKARRGMKGYIGVDGRARLFYDYLDDIDHVEIEFYDLQYYTNYSQRGGTKIADGKAACAAYGSSITLTESGGVVTAHLRVKGTTTNYGTSGDPSYGGLYTHFRFYAVLRDGYRLRLDYPKTNDAKAITVSAALANYSYDGGSGNWYPYIWLLGDSTTFSGTYAESATITLSSGYSGGANQFIVHSGKTAQYDFTLQGPVIGGRAYALKLKDSIAA